MPAGAKQVSKECSGVGGECRSTQAWHEGYNPTPGDSQHSEIVGPAFSDGLDVQEKLQSTLVF